MKTTLTASVLALLLLVLTTWAGQSPCNSKEAVTAAEKMFSQQTKKKVKITEAKELTELSGKGSTRCEATFKTKKGDRKFNFSVNTNENPTGTVSIP